MFGWFSAETWNQKQAHKGNSQNLKTHLSLHTYKLEKHSLIMAVTMPIQETIKRKCHFRFNSKNPSVCFARCVTKLLGGNEHKVGLPSFDKFTHHSILEKHFKKIISPF